MEDTEFSNRDGKTGEAVKSDEQTNDEHINSDNAYSKEIESQEWIREPGKIMRIGAMVRQLLDEVRAKPLDEKSCIRLGEIHKITISELASGLSPDLVSELNRLTLPFTDANSPSEAEIRIAQAQLVGWLEGLFHGIQAALMAQQITASSQLDNMRRRELPGGGGIVQPVDSGKDFEDRPRQDRMHGTYL
ncbi:MAG: bacterial proteasome activator family protein [Actinobacteria bacterium]|nr:bacterial proteasome activator family protein [Actinomycetota bacterium]MCL6104624.1 bacterial proteasome activator family protein [Actinomycetota bacterium]